MDGGFMRTNNNDAMMTYNELYMYPLPSTMTISSNLESLDDHLDSLRRARCGHSVVNLYIKLTRVGL